MFYNTKFNLGLIFVFLLSMETVFAQNPPLQNTSENIRTFWNTRTYPDFDWQKVSDAGSAYQGQFTGGTTSLNCPENTPIWNSLGPFGSLGSPVDGTQVDPDQIVMFSNGDIFSKGRICSRYMRVSIDNPCSAPDYVFENNYKLMPLNEVDVYIKKYKHLPEVPSALEFHQNGMDVAEMNFIMLKKVEELTLHLIEVDKRLQTVERENAELKERLNR